MNAKKNRHLEVTINFLPIQGMTLQTVVNNAVETYKTHCTAAIRLVRTLVRSGGASCVVTSWFGSSCGGGRRSRRDTVPVGIVLAVEILL